VAGLQTDLSAVTGERDALVSTAADQAMRLRDLEAAAAESGERIREVEGRIAEVQREAEERKETIQVCRKMLNINTVFRRNSSLVCRIM
jgi:hypothetical protein